MIYLIGGSPKTGKTTLVKSLLQSHNIPWVSTDTLQCIAREYTQKDRITTDFPASRQRGQNNDEKYSKFSTSQIIQAYQTQAQTSYKAIEVFIKCELTDGNNFAIEGYHITPELAHKLIQKHGGDKIHAIFLSKTDTTQLVSNFQNSSTPNDWILTRTQNQSQTLAKIAEMISRYSQYFESEAQKYNLPIINLDQNFDQQIQAAKAHLLSSSAQKI